MLPPDDDTIDGNGGPGDLDDALRNVATSLHAAAVEAAPLWIRAQVEVAAARSGVGLPTSSSIDDLVATTTSAIDQGFATLAAVDIDRQRTTPLGIMRSASAAITSYFGDHGADLAAGRDPLGLEPANLADISAELHEAGMRWGATKAALHLQRRRAEGQL